MEGYTRVPSCDSSFSICDPFPPPPNAWFQWGTSLVILRLARSVVNSCRDSIAAERIQLGVHLCYSFALLKCFTVGIYRPAFAVLTVEPHPPVVGMGGGGGAVKMHPTEFKSDLIYFCKPALLV